MSTPTLARLTPGGWLELTFPLTVVGVIGGEGTTASSDGASPTRPIWPLQSNIGIADSASPTAAIVKTNATRIISGNKLYCKPNIVGPTGSTISLRTVDNSPVQDSRYVKFVNGSFNTIHAPVTIPLTNQYSGPLTDVEIFARGIEEPGRLNINTAVGETSFIIEIAFNLPVVMVDSTKATVQVNGITKAITGAVLPGGSGGAPLVRLTVSASVVVDDVITISWSAGFVTYRYSLSSPTNCLALSATTIINTAGFFRPAAVNVRASDLGTRLYVDFNTNIEINSSLIGVQLSPPDLGLTSSLGYRLGPDRQLYVVGVSGTSLILRVEGTPIYNSEVLRVENINGNLAYYFGSIGGIISYGNLPFDLVRVITSGGAQAPDEQLITLTIQPNGTLIHLLWGGVVEPAPGVTIITVVATFSPPGPNFQYQRVSHFTVNGRTTFVFQALQPTTPIRIGDICTSSIPEGIGFFGGVGGVPTPRIETASTLHPLIPPLGGLTNPDGVPGSGGGGSSPAVEGLLINNSTVPYPAPLLVTGTIQEDGRSIILVFDKDVQLGPNANILDVVVTDISSMVVRTLRGDGATLISSTEVFLNVIPGTVFGTDLPSPGDGDSVTINTRGFAGLVNSQLSIDASYPSPNAPLNTAAINNSTQPEIPAVVRVFWSAEITANGDRLKVAWDGFVFAGTALPQITGTYSGTVIPTFLDYELGDNGEHSVIVYALNTQIRAQSIESVDLVLPGGVAVSLETASPSILYTVGSTQQPGLWVNNSTVPLPSDPGFPPILQDAFVSLNGKTIGLFWDVTVYTLSGTVELTGSLSGKKTATVVANELTLSTSLVVETPFFAGELVTADIPEGLVVSATNQRRSLSIINFVVTNNSAIPEPRNITVDSASINSGGNTLTINFDRTISFQGGFIWVEGSKSGKHLIQVLNVAANVVTAEIAGIVFIHEVVKLYIMRGVFTEDKFDFTGNSEILDQPVVNNSTVILPTLASGLIKEV